MFFRYNGTEVRKMQESRLFRIVYYLLEKGKCTASELAEKFEVSIRTIYRDIDVISSAGIPIYATQGKGGGISILENYTLDKSLLSEQEREQIPMALQGMIATEGKNSDVLLTKLGGLFQAKSVNWIEVDFSDWKQNSTSQNTFDMIKEAIFQRKMISFDYFDSKGENMERRVSPIRLVFKGKGWYLYGFCFSRNDYRFFKLTRIKNIEIHTENFQPEYIPSTIERKIQNEKNITVKLKFDKRVAFRVYDEFTDAVIEDNQGNLYVQTDLPDNERLYCYVLSFGDCVEVIEPQSVRCHSAN